MENTSKTPEVLYESLIRAKHNGWFDYRYAGAGGRGVTELYLPQGGPRVAVLPLNEGIELAQLLSGAADRTVEAFLASKGVTGV